MATPATAPVCMAAPCPIVPRIAAPYPSGHAARTHGIQRGAVGPEAARNRPLGATWLSSRMRRGRPLGMAWPNLRRGSRPARGRRAAVVPQGAARLSAGPENGEHALVVAPEHPT